MSGAPEALAGNLFLTGTAAAALLTANADRRHGRACVAVLALAGLLLAAHLATTPGSFARAQPALAALAVAGAAYAAGKRRFAGVAGLFAASGLGLVGHPSVPSAAALAVAFTASSVAAALAGARILQSLHGADDTGDAADRRWLLAQALAVGAWLAALPADLRTELVAAPVGYELLGGAVGLGIVTPLLLARATTEPAPAFLRSAAILVGGLALRLSVTRVDLG